MVVKWNSAKSTSFKISNGVLSPVLSNICINDLLVELSQSGAGIQVNRRFCGCSTYADDFSLQSASPVGMKHLLQICDTYARQNYLKFNSKKSKTIVFTNRRSVSYRVTDFYINDEYLIEVSEVTHLGHVLSSFIGDSTAAVKERCRKFYGSLYSIIGSVKGI